MMRICIFSMVAGLLLTFAVGPWVEVRADEPEVFRRLRNEPATMFDAGIKRLRRLVVDAAVRFASAAEAGPTTRVWYADARGTLEIEFRYFLPDKGAKGLSKDQCLARHKVAVREIFNIGRTAYVTNLSFDERVRRRLATLFAREPIINVKEVIAMGQRLSQLTLLTVRIFADEKNEIVSCRATVAAQVGKG